MKKINNKGFTLIELLAVIAILSILIVVAFPGVISLYNSAKLNTFKSQAQSVWRSIDQQIIKDSIEGNNYQCYIGGITVTTPANAGKIEITGNIRYKAAVDGTGKITSLTVEQTDGTNTSFKATGTAITTITAITASGAPTIGATPACP